MAGDKRFGFELPQLLIFAWLIVLYLLLTPGLIWSVLRYKKSFNHPFIHCRRPKLVITCCILTIIYSSIYQPLILILTQFKLIPYLYDNLTIETYMFLFNALPLLLISLHFSIRYFQLYYDLNYNSSMADQIWTQAINTKTNNFYIKNRVKFGKPRFQYITFSIVMFIVNGIIITMVLLELFGDNTIYIAQIIIVAVLILSIIPLIIIFRKLTSFLDAIKIRTELLWNIIFSFLAIACIAAHSFMYIFMDNKDDVINYGYTIISVVISLIYFCICYMMTLYIILQPEAQMGLLPSRSPTAIHKYSMASSNGTPVSKFTYSPSSLPQSAPEIANRMSAYSHHSSHNHSGNMTPALSRTQSMNLNAIRLPHICKNDDTFKLFIRHLAKEYCIENALFLFESQQFKKQCNEIEEQISMMTRNSKSGADLAINIPIETNPNKAVARISTSKSISSMNSRRGGLYSKKAKNLLSGKLLSWYDTIHVHTMFLYCPCFGACKQRAQLDFALILVHNLCYSPFDSA